jgi:inner membrane protein
MSLKLLIRFATIGALVVFLLIPLALIDGLISERSSFRATATARVERNTASAQRVLGPLLIVPWTDTQDVVTVDEHGTARHQLQRTTGTILRAPLTLRSTGTLVPSIAHVGLYEVNVYEWRATMQATFDPALPAPAADATRVWGTPYLVVSVSDVRGLVGSPKLRVDKLPVALASGTRDLTGKLNGIHGVLPEIAGGAVAVHELEFELTLKGTHSLELVPIGGDNHISMESSWPHPKFDGYSPHSEVTDHGFTASWDISALASNAQAALSGGPPAATAAADTSTTRDLPSAAAELSAGDSVQVSLVQPVDVYTRSERANKYGILFVVLTFVGFVLFELVTRVQLHPVQYLLVGLALAIFFLLLLSLSEHLEFWQAYAIAASACIGLQLAYLSGVLRSWVRAAGFSVMFTALYGVLYALLASEDNALLMGSLLLFAVLAAVMWITRKLDWSQLGAPAQPSAQGSP